MLIILILLISCIAAQKINTLIGVAISDHII